MISFLVINSCWALVSINKHNKLDSGHFVSQGLQKSNEPKRMDPGGGL